MLPGFCLSRQAKFRSGNSHPNRNTARYGYLPKDARLPLLTRNAMTDNDSVPTSLHTSSRCLDCGRALKRSVWLLPGSRAIPWHDRKIWVRDVLCRSCAHGSPITWRGEPCQVCQRMLYHRVGQDRFGIRSDPRCWWHTLCSKRCQYRSYTQTQKAHRDRIRQQTLAERKYKCRTCRKVFTPHRNDAKYCSGACRQKAHRHRQQR